MKQLYISYAEQRRLHGMDSFGTPSRFIAEIPEDLIEEVRPRIQLTRPMLGSAYRPAQPATQFRVPREEPAAPASSWGRACAMAASAMVSS